MRRKNTKVKDMPCQGVMVFAAACSTLTKFCYQMVSQG